MKELMTRGISSYLIHDSLIVSSGAQGVAEGVLEGCFRERLGGSVVLR